MTTRTAEVRNAPSFVSCLALLAIFELSLRCFGLRRTVRFMRRYMERSPERPVQPGLITAAVRQVVTAAAFYPSRALCLEQSLVLYFVLRRRGVPAELKVGVQPFPFVAHAWVEHNGSPLNEHEEFVTRLAPFPSFGA